MDEHQRILEHRFHLLRIGDEVGREVAAVELHPVDGLEIRLEPLRFLDRDHAILADLLHRLGDQIADLLIVVCRDGTHLGNLLAPSGRNGDRLELLDDGGDGLVDAALERHRIDAGGDVLEALTEDRLSEHSGGGGAITGDVRRLGRDFLHHLRAHVLERIAQLDFLGNGHSVLGDGRRTELLVDHDVPALGAERDLDRIGQLIDAALECRARINVKMQFLGSHNWDSCLLGSCCEMRKANCEKPERPPRTSHPGSLIRSPREHRFHGESGTARCRALPRCRCTFRRGSCPQP